MKNSKYSQKDYKEITPAIFVGVGGTGKECLRGIKRQLKPIYGGKIPSIYQFLNVDTAPLKNLPGEEFIRPDEYVSLGECNPSKVAKHAEKCYPHVNAWLPDKSPGITSTNIGAGQRRYIGRMSFFMNYPKFFEALEHKLTNIHSVSAVEELQMKGFQINSIPQIFVFTSLAGGTGAGIFLDVAYTIRSLAPETLLTGVLFLADTYFPVLRNKAGRERAKANCYAALLELERFMSKRQFSCDYDSRDIEVDTAPFDVTYLVSSKGKNKRIAHTRDVVKMVSHWTSTQVAAGLGGKQLEELSNIADHGTFSALTAAALVYPADKINDYGSLRLGQALIDQGYLANTDITLDQVALPSVLELDTLRTVLRQSQQSVVSNGRTPERVIRRAKKAAPILRALDGQQEDQAAALEMGRKTIQSQVIREQEAVAIKSVEGVIWDSLRHDGLAAAQLTVQGLHQRLTETGRAVGVELDKVKQRAEAAEDKVDEARRRVEKIGKQWWPIKKRAKMREAGLRASRLIAERDQVQFDLFALQQIKNLYQRLQGTEKHVQSIIGVGANEPRLDLKAVENTFDLLRSKFVERSRELGGTARDLLNGRIADPETFSLVTSIVDRDHIEAFYEQSGQAEDISTKYFEFNTQFEGVQDFLALDSVKLQQRLVDYARRPFEKLTSNVRLLDLLKQSDMQGELRLDALLARADVFLQYKANEGFDEVDISYTAHLGVDQWHQDEDEAYIEPLLSRHKAFNVTYTGDPHRIQAARTAHGFRLELLTDLEMYKRSYKELSESKKIPPLHIDKRWFPRTVYSNGRGPQENKEYLVENKEYLAEVAS